jgi:hypothetical protein
MSTASYLMNTSAVGDSVCTIPTVKALINEDKLYKVLANKRNCEILRLCGIDENFIVELNSVEEITAFDPKDSTLVCANIPGHAAYRIHLIDLFSIFPINAMLKPEEKNVQAVSGLLPSFKDEPWWPQGLGAYVVIGIGYVHKSRRLPVKAYSEIVEYCKSRGFGVVLLGSSRSPSSKQPVNFQEHPKKGCLDLINQTTIAESVAIMKDARCVITVDSGLVYLAALTDVPIVCGYTFVDPYYRKPYRNGLKGWNFFPVTTRSECKYCSNEFDNACPKGEGFSCAASLNGEDFIEAIKKVPPPSLEAVEAAVPHSPKAVKKPAKS